jgi:hypothetical protein
MLALDGNINRVKRSSLPGENKSFTRQASGIKLVAEQSCFFSPKMKIF